MPATQSLIDVSKCRRTAAGDFILDALSPNANYCVAPTGAWIWSIGKLIKPLPSVMADGSRETLEPGTLLASTSSRHYTVGASEAIECVWLR